MRLLTDLISSDPAFASEVLTIANSAIIPHRFAVTSILQAIALLGTHALKGLSLTVAVRAYLGRSMNYPSLRAIWRHNLATALLAEKLASAAWMDQNKAYTAGIMHDIGRFALAVLSPREYGSLLETHCGQADSILVPERDLFGFDHRQVGLHLIEEWKLPIEFRTSLREAGSPGKQSDPFELLELVNMSCRMADAIGFPAFAGCEASPFSDLLEECPVRFRSLFGSDFVDIAIDIGRKINAIESF
jgi:putative nucleotidyltransferase with HDIG domain